MFLNRKEFQCQFRPRALKNREMIKNNKKKKTRERKKIHEISIIASINDSDLHITIKKSDKEERVVTVHRHLVLNHNDSCFNL